MHIHKWHPQVQGFFRPYWSNGFRGRAKFYFGLGTQRTWDWGLFNMGFIILEMKQTAHATKELFVCRNLGLLHLRLGNWLFCCFLVTSEICWVLEVWGRQLQPLPACSSCNTDPVFGSFKMLDLCGLPAALFHQVSSNTCNWTFWVHTLALILRSETEHHTGCWTTCRLSRDAFQMEGTLCAPATGLVLLCICVKFISHKNNHLVWKTYAKLQLWDSVGMDRNFLENCCAQISERSCGLKTWSFIPFVSAFSFPWWLVL